MENRRFSRIPLKMPAKLSIGEDIYSLPTIDNLSVGGCSLELDLATPPDTPCRLWIPLDATTPGLGVDVNGVVLRTNAGSVSIRFDAITPESLFHLHNLVRYNAPDPDRIDEEILRRPGLR